MSHGMIESNPAVMMGKPVIAGTRITVESILEKLVAGESVDGPIIERMRNDGHEVTAVAEMSPSITDD